LKKKKKNRELQRHKPSSSAAINQLKQTDKESSVEAKEEITATVYTTVDGEVEEDKKPAAEVAQLGRRERFSSSGGDSACTRRDKWSTSNK